MPMLVDGARFFTPYRHHDLLVAQKRANNFIDTRGNYFKVLTTKFVLCPSSNPSFPTVELSL